MSTPTDRELAAMRRRAAEGWPTSHDLTHALDWLSAERVRTNHFKALQSQAAQEAQRMRERYERELQAAAREQQRAEAAEDRLTAVRELHCEQLFRTLDEDGNPDTYCEACRTGPYPCDTIRALDGDPS